MCMEGLENGNETNGWMGEGGIVNVCFQGKFSGLKVETVALHRLQGYHEGTCYMVETS